VDLIRLAVFGQRHLARAVDQLAADPGAPDPGEDDVVAPEDRAVGLEPRRGIGLEVVARELDGLWLAVPGIAASSYGGQVQSFADRVERQEQAQGGGAVVTAANSAPSRVFLSEGAERDGGAPERPGLLRF
jgi:hypothetical protein